MKQLVRVSNLLLAVVLVAWLLSEISIIFFRPDNLSDFKTDKLNVSLYTLQKNEDLYYIGTKKNPMFRLASGPQCYVFDSQGSMIEWTSDLGDSRDFVSKWGSPDQWQMLPKIDQDS